MSEPRVTSEILVNILRSNPFPQHHLLDDTAFKSFIEKRGIHIRAETLEYFEEQGLLYPIVRILEEDIFDSVDYHLNYLHQQNRLIFPSKDNFKPWTEYTEGFKRKIVPFYHPYQALLIKEITNSIALKYAVLQTKPTFVIKTIGTPPDHDKENKFLLKRLEEYQKLLSLLFMIEDKYLPQITQRFSGRGGVDINEFWEQWVDWRTKLEPQILLEQSGFSIAEIRKYRKDFAIKANIIDPLKDWYLLVRRISFSKREELIDNALLAQDYYQIVDVLGSFLFDLTGERQIDVTDLIHGPLESWKKVSYGKDVLELDDRDVMRLLLSEYEINPQDNLLLIVEGKTEKDAIPLISKTIFGRSLEQMGIRLFSLNGVDEISPNRSEKLLELLTSSQAYAKPYIILDNHGNARDVLKNYAAHNLIHPEHYRVWGSDFETDNFTTEEVFEEVCKQAKNQNKTLNVTLEKIREIQNRIPKDAPEVYHTYIIQNKS
jgi:hypothetical protein